MEEDISAICVKIVESKSEYRSHHDQVAGSKRKAQKKLHDIQTA